MNADKAFDVSNLRQACARCGIEANIPRNRRSADWQTDDDTPLDPELYRRRLVIERFNAWLDGFKALLVHYETSLQNWLALHWLAFTVLLLRKIAPPPHFLNSFNLTGPDNGILHRISLLSATAKGC